MKNILYVVLINSSINKNGKDYILADFPRVFSTIEKAKEFIDNDIKIYGDEIVSENPCKDCNEVIVKPGEYLYTKYAIFERILNME